MSHKNQQLYNLVFQSVNNIWTQYDIYLLKIETITSDAECALINALNNNFSSFQRVSCWFHLKQDLIKNPKKYGLFNKKPKVINPNITKDIIKQLCILLIEYNGNMDLYDEKIKNLLSKYKNYYNYYLCISYKPK